MNKKIKKFLRRKTRWLRKILPTRVGIQIENIMTYGRLFNEKNIKYFGEKIQYLKLYGNLEKYTNYADKYKVREYVSQKIGEEHLIPLFGVWDDPSKIDYLALPNKFVLKCNHGCGYNIVVKNKDKLDIKKANKKLRKWLGENFTQISREQQYKNIERKVICEEFISSKDGVLRDYKFFCSNGEPQIIFMKQEGHIKFYDINWNDLKLTGPAPEYMGQFEKPDNLEEMKEIARKLSEDFQFVRVDLYNIDGKIYFGELTFTHGGGSWYFHPLEKDEELAKMINIDNIK